MLNTVGKRVTLIDGGRVIGGVGNVVVLEIFVGGTVALTAEGSRVTFTDGVVLMLIVGEIVIRGVGSVVVLEMLTGGVVELSAVGKLVMFTVELFTAVTIS